MRAKTRAGFTLIELLVVIGAAVFLMAIVVVAADEEKEKQNRQKCASNLRQIGQAVFLYSNENKGAFPRVRYNPKSAKVKAYTKPDGGDPFKKEGPEANDITAAIMLLIKTQDIQQDCFVCPSSDATMEGVVMSELNNFPGKKHLSYSYANPYASPAAVKLGYKVNNSLPAEFVVLGDMNPGGDALLKVTTNSGDEEVHAGNSANHDHEGQNVAFGDGHVEWVTTPLSGIDQDNIYTFGKSGKDADKGGEGINGSPIGPGDTVLLPSADMTGEADKKDAKEK